MTLNSRSAKLSSPNVKVQDVPDKPTIGTPFQDGNNINVPFTAASTGGSAAVYRAISTPGNIEAISYGSSPIVISSGLSDGTSYTFSIRGETSTGSTNGYTVASNAVVPSFSSYDQIATIVLGSPASSFTFSSIPSGYKHLQVRASLKASSGGYWIGLQLNGDTGNNYSMHRLSSNASSISSSSTTSTSSHQIFGFSSGTSTGVPLPVIIDILDYSATNKNKTMRAMVAQAGSGISEMHLSSGAWYNTSAVSTLFLGAGGNFDTGSRVTVYGIKG